MFYKSEVQILLVNIFCVFLVLGLLEELRVIFKIVAAN